MIRLFFSIINKINTDLQEQFVKTAIAISILSTVYLLSGNIFLSFIVGLAIAILLLGWDSRVFIGIGLIFLLACPFLLAFEKKAFAEEMAVYAYYMLALGVLLQIIQYVRSSLFAKTKTKKMAKTEALEFWSKKKILAIVISIALFTVIASGGSFYYFYVQIKNEATENKKLIDTLIQANLKNKEQSITLASQIIEPTVNLATSVDITRDNVIITIENTTASTELGTTITDKFKKIGYLNVTATNIAEATVQGTLIQYCSNCFEIANELLSVLQKQTEVLFIEKPDLAGEIIIKIGKDQLVIANKDIAISLLNGSAVVGAALRLKETMVKDGFNINSVSSADNNNYKKTIIKYASTAIDKANIVKKYLSPLYADLELIEDPQIKTDIEVILGEI
jgi:hypothetical protein